MSMPPYPVRCDKCAFQSSSMVLWGSFQYRFPDGREVSLDRGFGWCHSCADLVPTEQLPEKESVHSVISRCQAAISEEVSKIEAHNRRFLERIKTFLRIRSIRNHRLENLHNKLEENSLLLDLLESRRSPPRCLECGGTDLSQGTESTHAYPRPIGIRHPECGGDLLIHAPPQMLDDDYISVRVSMRTCKYFDIEGNFLGEEQVEFKLFK